MSREARSLSKSRHYCGTRIIAGTQHNQERKSPIKDSASTNQDPAENDCVSANPLLTSEYKFQDGLSDSGKNKKIMAKLIVNKGVTPIALKLEKILEPKRHEVGTKISLLSSSRQAMKNNV